MPIGDNMYSIDLETAPINPSTNPYALEPYRAGKDSMITLFSIHGPHGYSALYHYKMDNFIDLMKSEMMQLKGKVVYCHNAIFDVSFLLATLGKEYVDGVRWRDTAILYKWLVNGQKASDMHLSYSLKACVQRALKDHPDTPRFLNVKSESVAAGENFDYWLDRAILDSKLTLALAERLESRLEGDNSGYIVTCNAILPIAEGYVKGIGVDEGYLRHYSEELVTHQKELLDDLNIKGSVITSSKQLADLLFYRWNLEPEGLTPKGEPSVSVDNLLRIQQKSKDARLDKVMEYRNLSTINSKYIQGFYRSFNYLKSHTIHGQPRLLSTNTGRMTYSTKFFDKEDFQTSIAMHQLPRKNKAIKRCLRPPEGYKVLYMDVSSQEGRIMAIQANEENMIRSYNEGICLHADLTEAIFGTPYEDIFRANIDGHPKELVEQRQAGKLTNLSSFYRIGAKALAAKFFTTYGYDISIQTAQSYLRAFSIKNPGVREYWKTAIANAKRTGYAEAWGGWKYRIDTLDWKGESNAINHPIQGSGAIQIYATISIMNKNFPELILVSQVHDSLAYFIPEKDCIKTAKAIRDFLNSYNYGYLLNFNQTVPIIVDAHIGDNFADLRSINNG